jgi:iron complex outermembrane receptor protein
VAGFSQPGDWGTRTLILLNGHSMPENIFGSANYFGEDFALDMTLVERIEIVRGPSSALYGSNGLLATINVITKSPEHTQGTTARTEAGSLGERKLTVTRGMRLPGGSSLLVSGTAFGAAGQRDIYIPEYDTPATNQGLAVNMDGQRYYRLFADFTAGNWQITSLAVSRRKIQPVSWGDTVFNDRGTRVTDQRAFVDVQYAREYDSGHSLRWKTYYDAYRFKGVYHYPLDGGGINLNREFDAGDWVGSRVTDRFASLGGFLTAGAEIKFDVRALQSTADIQPVYCRTCG